MKIKKIIHTSLLIGGVAFTANINAQPLPTNQQNEEKAWISIGVDVLSYVQQQGNLVNLSYDPNQNNNRNNNDVKLVQIPLSQIDELSEVIHDEFNRCGGFFFHDSYDEASSYTSNGPGYSSFAAVNYTIDNQDTVNTLVNELNNSNLIATVDQLAEYHNRYYSQQTGVDAAKWVKAKWAGDVINRSDISVDFYQHSWDQSSVIATIEGTSNSDEVIVIGAHLDSINKDNNADGHAPGADDNASGISVITETLRSISASGFKPKKTIKIIAYAAEEVGLKGSKAIAQEFSNNSTNVIGVINFDMTGYQGTSGVDIVLMTDYTNNNQGEFVKNIITEYFTFTVREDKCGYACSDHASWHNEGFSTSMIAESMFNDSNPNLHTTSDTEFSSAHAIKFVKVAVAFAAELAKGSTETVSAEPIADFTYTCEKLVCNFNGTESTNANVYAWDFGDGESSTNSKPTHTFSTSGDYTVQLTVTSSNDVSDAKNKTVTVSEELIPEPSELANGKAIVINGTKGNENRFIFAIPSDASDTNVTMSGGTGDADIYVKFGTEPTTSDYDCRPYKNGNDESCQLTDAGGTYHILIHAYKDYAGANLKGSYKSVVAEPLEAKFTSNCNALTCSFDASASTGPVDSYIWNFGGSETGTGNQPMHTYDAAGSYDIKLTIKASDGTEDTTTHTVTVFESNDALSNSQSIEISRNKSEADLEYTFEVPTGASNINVSISGGIGDADLFVKFDSQVTTSDYDCRPYENGNSESCDLTDTDGTYYILVDAYETYSGVSLVGSYDIDSGSTSNPIAKFTLDCNNLDCTFDASQSSDDGTVVSYSWAYGDSSAAGTGVAPSHSYNSAGDYTVKLTITDNSDITNSIEHTVTVTDTGAINCNGVSEWAMWSSYNAGDKVIYQGDLYTANQQVAYQQPSFSNAWDLDGSCN